MSIGPLVDDMWRTFADMTSALYECIHSLACKQISSTHPYVNVLKSMKEEMDNIKNTCRDNDQVLQHLNRCCAFADSKTPWHVVIRKESEFPCRPAGIIGVSKSDLTSSLTGACNSRGLILSATYNMSTLLGLEKEVPLLNEPYILLTPESLSRARTIGLSMMIRVIDDGGHGTRGGGKRMTVAALHGRAARLGLGRCSGLRKKAELISAIQRQERKLAKKT